MWLIVIHADSFVSVSKDLKDGYDLVHAGNSKTIEGIKPLLLSLSPVPQLLFCSSQWSPEQQEEVQRIAKNTIPGIKTATIPAGLHAQKGGDVVVQWLKDQVVDWAFRARSDYPMCP